MFEQIIKGLAKPNYSGDPSDIGAQYQRNLFGYGRSYDLALPVSSAGMSTAVRRGLTKAKVQRYRSELESRGCPPLHLNVDLTAVRKLPPPRRPTT